MANRFTTVCPKTVHNILRTVVCPVLSVCKVGVLWPNGVQDATWYGSGRPRPRPLCVRWGPSSPPRKGAQQHPIFAICGRGQDRGPCRLWPSGWMDQDATCYGGRPRPRRHCVRWGPSSPHGNGYSSPHFSVHFALSRSPISATAELL